MVIIPVALNHSAVVQQNRLIIPPKRPITIYLILVVHHQLSKLHPLRSTHTLVNSILNAICELLQPSLLLLLDDHSQKQISLLLDIELPVAYLLLLLLRHQHLHLLPNVVVNVFLLLFCLIFMLLQLFLVNWRILLVLVHLK